MPALGDRRVSEISQHEVLSVVAPVLTAIPETGRKVRGAVKAIFTWAQSKGYRTDNPAGDIIDGAPPAHARRQGAPSRVALSGGAGRPGTYSGVPGPSPRTRMPGVDHSHCLPFWGGPRRDLGPRSTRTPASGGSRPRA